MDAGRSEDDVRLEEFRALSQELQAQLPAAVRRQLPGVVAALPDWRVPRQFHELGPELENRLRQAYAELGDRGAVDAFGAATVAELAAELPARLADRGLPAEITSLVPAALDRLLVFLRSGAAVDYRLDATENDYFLKDLRFVAGLSVPCGAGVMDLRSPMGRRHTLELARRGRSVAAVGALLRGRALSPWLAFHVEARHLDEMNEAGWDRAYLRMAAVLRVHREVQGITAGGWMYDPQLTEVSPRHSYLYLRPLERGGVLVPIPTPESDVARATLKSASRRRAHEEGRYTPQAHDMLWPRRRLLRWAGSQPPLSADG